MLRSETPSLTEPGVKYFLNNTLKNVHKNRILFNNNIYNLTLFIGFVLIFIIILSYKYYTKPTEEQLKEKEELKKHYIIDKIKTLGEEEQKINATMITDLPKFESEYDILHKNFYKV